MPTDDYRNLLLAAGVMSYQRDRFTRCIDALISQEHLETTALVGVGGGPRGDIYVVHERGVYTVSESGMFTKRHTVQQVGLIARIANLRGAQETLKSFEFLLIAEDPDGGEVFRLSWPLQLGNDAGTESAARERKHLFEVISEAMDRLGAASATSASRDCLCGNGSMTIEHLREHVVDLMVTDGVEALTYECPACGIVAGELWHRNEAGRNGAPAGLYAHLLTAHNLH